MTKEEIKQAVEEYFNEMFAEDADYLDHITDSWIYDAECWFLNRIEKEGIKVFTNDTDYVYTKETEELDAIFWTIVVVRKNELYDEKYGERDAKLILRGLVYQAKELQDTFESLKHNLKVFPTFNNVVSTDINNLLEHLHILSDIENDKIESLKEKGE